MCPCKGKDCCDQPKENFSISGALAADVIKNLLVVARTGIMSFVFKDAETAALARTIAAIAAENQYLKRILGIFTPATVNVGTGAVTIKFGAEDYLLQLPALTESAKLKLAGQFEAAASMLKQQAAEAAKKPNPAQQLLPFSSDN